MTSTRTDWLQTNLFSLQQSWACQEPSLILRNSLMTESGSEWITGESGSGWCVWEKTLNWTIIIILTRRRMKVHKKLINSDRKQMPPASSPAHYSGRPTIYPLMTWQERGDSGASSNHPADHTRHSSSVPASVFVFIMPPSQSGLSPSDATIAKVK